MNRFAIFFLFTWLCISFASAQVDRGVYSEIAEAHIIDSNGGQMTYNKPPVYLYKTTDPYGNFESFYDVQDGLGRISGRFLIEEDSTTVTKQAIAFISAPKVITLTLKGVDTFAFYRRLFSLNDFSGFPEKFPVQSVVLVENSAALKKVSAIKAKNVLGNRWVFVAVNDKDDTPHLIFPSYRVRSLTEKTISGTKVSCSLEAKTDIPIVIQFRNSDDANRVYNLIGNPKGQRI